ncbi:MAG TPA: hypothetical protein VMV77_15090, partial [Bacteroidales bacterium]|nr:hypothetical protein [Bacteroidales bacterium]
MAWGQTYQILTRDRHDILWTTKIYEDGFSGDITNLIGAGIEPLKFEFCNESDDIFDVFKSSRVILTVWSYTMFALDDLFLHEDMFHKVEIYQGANLYFSGYVDPHQSTESYGPVPYPVNIYCIDGLTLLKNILYEESEGVAYNGHILESQIILDILGKIGFTTFREYVNIYEDAMDKEAGDSPMDQLQINTDVFAEMYCDEVLKEILKKYNANIRQIDGVFSIFRPKELIGEVVYGRIFTAATTKSSTSITPRQYINRSDYASALLQVSGSVKTNQSPAKKVISHQDYGNKESWIDNYEFKAETFDSEAVTLDKWTIINPDYIDLHHISELMTSEKEGIALGSADSLEAVYLYQNIGYAIISTKDLLSLEFEFGWFNNDTSNNAVTNIYIQIICDDYYLKEKDDTYTEWTMTPSAIIIFPVDVLGSTTVPSGFTDWFKYTRQIPGIPITGKIEIKVGSQQIANIYNCLKYIKFYVGSYLIFKKISTTLKPVGPKRPERWSTLVRKKFDYEEVKIVEHEYIKENAINGAMDKRDYVLGDIIDSNIDNILGQFAGALAVGVAQTRIDTITLSGSSGQCVLLCNGIGGFAVWDTSLTQTAANFVTNYAAGFLLNDIVLTSSGADVIFTASEIGFEFSGDTFVSDQSGTLDGKVYYTTPAWVLSPTASWNTRGGLVAKPLIELIVDEIAEQYSRPKQLIDMAIMETDVAAS